MSLPAVAQTVPDLAAFFDVSLDMLCIRDADFRFVRVNQAWTRTLGHPVSVLEGARMLDFIHPDDASPSGAKMTGIGPDGEINGFINRYRHADGSYRSLEWR
ncbi:MAG TPA: PAS domain S-box protein, partial [Phenylobacterium sp.]|nr:PAS domain S-box protein [Phenylobacterium sp.]